MTGIGAAKRVGRAFPLAMAVLFATSSFATPLMTEKVRKIINDRQDRLKLREKGVFVIDRSERMLIPRMEDVAARYFDIAHTPPEISMMIAPGLEPAYFPEDQRAHAHWANWNRPTRTEDGRFIFAVGNGCTRGGKIFLYEYCPIAQSVEKILDVSRAFGWTDSSRTDGKIHGRMGIMPDGTLWLGSQYGDYSPDPWFDEELIGSPLLSYNVHTGKTENWGALLPGNTLSQTSLDVRRGVLLATGEFPTVLCRDVTNHRTLFTGPLPEGWTWFNRAALFDETTGKFWSTDASDSLARFLSYDPERNRFERHEFSPPENPFFKSTGNLRAYTERRAMDGAYYCISYNGAMFRFRPEKGSVEPVGTNWGRGRYASTIALDPSGRYLYYMPGGKKMQNANEYGPLVQYDVETGRKKVLAWLVDYYYEKYGYWAGGTYGMEISEDGSFLVIVMNGAFRLRDDLRDYPYEYPALFVVRIPEEERQ